MANDMKKKLSNNIIRNVVPQELRGVMLSDEILTEIFGSIDVNPVVLG